MSFALDQAQWGRWLELLRSDVSGAGAAEFRTVGWYLPVALAPRLVAAVAVTVVAALLDRRWLIPVAVLLAMPVVWGNSPAVLAACVPLYRADRADRADRTDRARRGPGPLSPDSPADASIAYAPDRPTQGEGS